MRGITLIAVGTVLASCNLPLPVRTPLPAATPSPTTPPTPTPTPRPTPTALPTLPPTPLPGELGLQASALRPGFEGDLALAAERTRYWIEYRVDYNPPAERALIEGLARIRYVNTDPDPLSEVVVMLWPNDDQYRAEMSAGPALIEGELRPALSLAGGLAQRYELPRPVPTGGSVDLSLPFRIATSGPIGGVAPSRFGISQQVLFAPTGYPLLPLRRDGEWLIDVAPPGGDTTTSEVSLYQVSILAPPELAVVTTGVELGRETLPDGSQLVSVVSGPARDFAFAIGPLLEEAREIRGVQIRGWALAHHRNDLSRMVSAAATQVQILSESVGPYPYVELDLVDLPGAYGGIEYPGLVTIGTLGGASLIHPTVHEVGHQWFYGLIGDDQLREPWLDEGAATYTEVLYYEHTEGSGSATGLLSDFREQLRDHPDPELPIGLAVGEYASPREYALFVYLKGALFFDALRAELGDDVFFGFLQSYFAEFRYQIASAEDFQHTAEATCGCDLQDLFDLWVYEGGELPGF